MPRVLAFRAALRALSTALVLLPLSAACGGDEGGSYEDYVSGFCKAQLKANERVDPLVDGVNAGNITPEILKQMGEIYGDFAGDLEELNPPATFADFHDDWVAAWERAAKQMKTGDITVDPFLELEQMEMPSEEQTAELRAAAKDDPDCIAAGVTFEEE